MRKKNLIILTIFALCLFFTNNQEIQAANYIANSAPESFVTNKAGRNYSNGQLTDTKNDAVMANVSLSANATGRGNNVTDYHTSTGEKIFCLDRMIEYEPGVTYTKTTEAVDFAIVYIITHAEEFYTNNYPNKGTNQDLELSWFTQVAIWKYQNASNFTSINMNQPDIIEENVQINTTTYYTYSNGAIGLWSLADRLVEEARGHSNTDPSAFNNLTFNYDGGHSVDKENKTIKTSLISIQDGNNVSEFSLDLSKAPNGTKVYNEEGVELTDLGKLAGTTKFYLIVPVSNIDNYTYDFNISATANYSYYKGHKYTSGSYQPVVLVTPENKPLMAALKVEGSHIDDTASSFSKVMYISGLFILLCGVGIIYANIKPKRQQI